MDQNLMIAKYRWEFIRRNEIYRKDWSAFFEEPKIELAEELLEKWGCVNFPQSRDFNRKWEDIDRIPGTIWTRELEKEFFWPDLKNLIIKKMATYSSTGPSCNIYPCLIPEPAIENDDVAVCQEPIHATGYLICNDGKPLRPPDKGSIPDEITIKIENFRSFVTGTPHTQNLHREKIVAQINEQLIMWQRFSLQHELSSETRFRFEEYDQHLTIWDLVQKKGHRWKEIQEEVFRGDKEPGSAMKKAKSSYHAARRLIENAHKIFREI